MISTTSSARLSSRASRPSNSNLRHRANFARAAVFVEFGRHAFALDQVNFEDRKPWQMPVRSPDAR